MAKYRVDFSVGVNVSASTEEKAIEIANSITFLLPPNVKIIFDGAELIEADCNHDEEKYGK